MKKMIRIAALVAALAFGLSTNAQAKDMEHYGGIGVGGLHIKSSTAGSGWATGVFGLIGTDINDFFGLEVRGGTATDAPVGGLNYKLNWFVSYMGKIQLPVGEKLSIYGLGGGTTGNFKINAAGLNTVQTTVTFGGGAKFQVDENWSLGAEWVRYWHNAKLPITNEQLNIDSISATLDLRF